MAQALNTPECTANDPTNTHAGEVTGTLTVADVRGNDANGIAGPTGTSTVPTTAEEFAEVIALIRAGKTYVNVHSSKFAPERSAARSATAASTTTTTTMIVD